DGLPTAVTIAAEDAAAGARIVDLVGSSSFRPYLSADPVGAQIGGAVKNVLAIATGVVTGLGLGENARAALVTRGLAETVRLGRALGARMETLMGLSGLGDISLTCNSVTSRNMSFGIELAKGRAPADILAERDVVTEGVATAPAVVALARRHAVDVPICEAVCDVVEGNATLEQAMASLLAREFKPEYEG